MVAKNIFKKVTGLGPYSRRSSTPLLRCAVLGYECDHPQLQSQIRALERLEIEERDTLRVAPCFSPVWDTAIAIVALAESGISAEHEALQKASDWLLRKEVKEYWRLENKESRG